MTVEEMEELLDRIGVEHVGSRGNEIQGYCPAHVQRTGHPDHNPSWFINSETGAHICFSCKFKGGVAYLIAVTQGFYVDGGYDLERAQSWLKEDAPLSDMFEKATVKKDRPIFEELVTITDATLAAFTTPPEYALKSRGLTQQAADKHQLKFDERKDLWIIPIRSMQTNKLMGWQEKGYRGRYFRNYPTGVTKSMALFGYQAYEGGTMIVVESPLDVVRLESVGITGGVATYGSHISKEQLQYLYKKADKLVFAMDNDEAGSAASLEMLHMAHVFGFECWFFDYSHTELKDVGGMSKREIVTGIENARHSVRYASWFAEGLN